jgi:hypothetical protein
MHNSANIFTTEASSEYFIIQAIASIHSMHKVYNILCLSNNNWIWKLQL